MNIILISIIFSLFNYNTDNGELIADPIARMLVRQINRGHIDVIDARFPWDPKHGVFGFYSRLYEQRYDKSWQNRGHVVTLKAYLIDFHNMAGMICTVTDPDCKILAISLDDRRHPKFLRLKTMEVTDEYRVVYDNKLDHGEKFGRTIVLILGTNPKRQFDAYISGYPD